MYFIFHGEDEFSRSEEMHKIRAKMGDPQFADLNTTRFDGRKLSLSELRHACNAIPFLSDRRVTIVEGMLARFDPRHKKGEEEAGEEPPEVGSKELVADLEELLRQLPESVWLFFLENKMLAKGNPILKMAEADKTHAQVREFSLLKDYALPDWIRNRVNDKGGTIESEAAEELAAQIGSDLRLLDNEIEKLLTYRSKEKIRREDVRLLVTFVRESVIFDLVDAVGEGKTERALKLLHAHLDENAAPAYLMTMITRQFRLLLQVKDLGARGIASNAIGGRLGIKDWMASKLWKQAQHFTLPRLEAVYDELLKTDLAMKTGRSEPTVALDMLIVQLAR